MYLELDHLKKHFDGREVVRDLSLTLEQGQLLCILGASGCGKTTTLNMIGGFLEPDSGSVRLDGQDITRIPPEQRPVTTVFQSYGLFPHMTVIQNVVYGLKFRGVKREQARQKGMRYLEMVGLADYASAYIQEISGGQQQRVALARALIVEPKLCLLDEPFCPWTFAGSRPARLWLNSWIWRAWYGQRTAGCLKLSRDRRNLNAG